MPNSHLDQLQKAFDLLEKGDKARAYPIVRRVLEQDANNINAWWLMSFLAEDEDKAIKALQNILSIDPYHDGARKRFTKLDSRKQQIQSISAEKDKNIPAQDSGYWDRLSQKPKHSPGKWEKWIRDGMRARLEFARVTFVILAILIILQLCMLFIGNIIGFAS